MKNMAVAYLKFFGLLAPVRCFLRAMLRLQPCLVLGELVAILWCHLRCRVQASRQTRLLDRRGMHSLRRWDGQASWELCGVLGRGLELQIVVVLPCVFENAPVGGPGCSFIFHAGAGHCVVDPWRGRVHLRRGRVPRHLMEFNPAVAVLSPPWHFVCAWPRAS